MYIINYLWSNFLTEVNVEADLKLTIMGNFISYRQIKGKLRHWCSAYSYHTKKKLIIKHGHYAPVLQANAYTIKKCTTGNIGQAKSTETHTLYQTVKL
jgi:hypothetical protein